MSKFLLFLLMLFAALLVLRAAKRARRQDPSPRAQAHPSQRMLACRVCGVYVPESETLRLGEAVFCCEEHRRRAGFGQ